MYITWWYIGLLCETRLHIKRWYSTRSYHQTLMINVQHTHCSYTCIQVTWVCSFFFFILSSDTDDDNRLYQCTHKVPLARPNLKLNLKLNQDEASSVMSSSLSLLSSSLPLFLSSSLPLSLSPSEDLDITEQSLHAVMHDVLAQHSCVCVCVCVCVKRDLLQCQYRPLTVSKETYYSVKRDLLQCQKRPLTV